MPASQGEGLVLLPGWDGSSPLSLKANVEHQEQQRGTGTAQAVELQLSHFQTATGVP